MRGSTLLTRRCLGAACPGRIRQILPGSSTTGAVPPYRPFATEAELAAARPYEEMPGPKPLPLVGNYYRFIPGFSSYDFSSDLMKAHQQLRDEFGDIVRFGGLSPRRDVVFVYRPEDTETMFRNEGAWPERPGFRSLVHYRHVTRKDFFQGVGGVLVDQGEAWQAARSQVNPVMMQTKTVQLYASRINDVAQQLTDRIPEFRDDEGKLPANFVNELHKWALESIATVALDTRLGCLEADLAPGSEPQRMIDAVHTMFKCLHVLEVESLLWTLIPTKTWKLFVKTLDYFVEVSMKYIERSMARSAELRARGEEDESVLAKFLARDPNPKRAVVMALDMLMAGVDSTSYAVAFVLLQLAQNPAAQERLHEELRALMPSPDTPLDTHALENMKFLRACIRETLRMQPIVAGNARTTQSDIVLANYRIPKGVDVLMTSGLMSRMDEHFPNASQFIPDRWLRAPKTPAAEGCPAHAASASKAHPFVSLPFGHGSRKCVGMRFASLEMEMLLAKLVRRYRWEWHEPPMKYRTSLIRTPVDPLRFTVTER